MAKLQLVREAFVPGTPDFCYYAGLCSLLEVQRLTEEDKKDEAWQKLTGGKAELERAERELSSSGCYKRSQRIQRRRLLLELDLVSKLQGGRVAVRRARVEW